MGTNAKLLLQFRRHLSHYDRFDGEFYDEQSEAETERERPIRIWLARMDDTNFRYPIKLEARTWLGTIRGRVLHFRSTMGR